MKIKFSWGTGWMETSAEHVAEDMQMSIYRKWVKLFAQYGTPEQHKEFLQFVISYIRMQEAKCTELQNDLEERQAKADRLLPTVMTLDYWEREAKLYQKKLNGATAKLKRYKTIYTVLEGLVS